MRYAFSLPLVAVMVCLSAAPAVAGDGSIPPSTLRSLGLADMQVLSDTEGMQVRGLSGFAAVRGISSVNGLLLDPSTKNFIFGSDSNKVMANAAATGCHNRADAYKQHLSYIGLQLHVNNGGSVYNGSLYGGAGGSGHAWAK